MTISQIEQFTREAYTYFNNNIRSIETVIKDGVIKVVDGGHNDDIDAFRHAYVSAMFSKEYTPLVSDTLGRLNELKNDINVYKKYFNDPNFDEIKAVYDKEKNMDLWNNSIGREIQNLHPSATSSELANYLKQYLDSGELITTPEDSRQYETDLSSFGDDLSNQKTTIDNSISDLKDGFTELYNDIVSEVISAAKVHGNPLLEALDLLEEKSQPIKDYYEQAAEKAEEVADAVQNAKDKLLEAISAISPPKDPLIIDMNKDGLELNSWEDSGVLFDLNGDLLKESTSWVKAEADGGDDVFLAIDKNSNGSIDDIEELFGTETQSGFSQLAAYDSNHDGLINSTDTQFNLLKLWHDKNANGTTEAGELTNLTDNNIKEISLNAINATQVINGSIRSQKADVTFNDNSKTTINEVWFGVNNFNSIDDLTPDTNLELEALLLPFSRGYGDLNSWTVAMSLDPELLELAQTINNLDPKEFYKIDDLFTNFLLKWAAIPDNITQMEVYGVDAASSTDLPNSTFLNSGFDVRKTAFLEKITALDFNLQPRTNPINLIEESWNLFYNILLSRFLVQGTFKDIFPQASYDFITDEIDLNSTLDEAITNIKSLNQSLDQSSFINYAYHAQNILQLNKDQFRDPQFDAKVETMISNIISSVTIAGFNFNGIFNIGSDINDILQGTTNSDIIKGLDGRDAGPSGQKQSSGLFLASERQTATLFWLAQVVLERSDKSDTAFSSNNRTSINNSVDFRRKFTSICFEANASKQPLIPRKTRIANDNFETNHSNIFGSFLNKTKKTENYSCGNNNLNLTFTPIGSCYSYNNFTVKNNNMQGLHGGDSRYSLPHSKNTQIKQKIGLKNIYNS